MKQYCESPKMPMVPGPRVSDRMLIMEKAPLMIPNPSPAT
uniref:Uncharacterized protein n=1 Tax=Anguilla anguilla TaxID=7936 RepID=A0A0E9TAH6_ANGAN